MSYIPLIIKSEFRKYVNLGANVGKDDEIDMHIKNMQEIDFLGWCDTPFYNDLLGDRTLRTELQDLLDNFIKPYLIMGTYEKFLLWHGRNISQKGIRTTREDTSDEVSDKVRGELMADVRHQCNVFLNKLKMKLQLSNYTFDGVLYVFYDEIDKKRVYPKTGIKQVGGSNGKYFDRKTRQWL